MSEFPECDIENCGGAGSQTLTVVREVGEPLYLYFCPDCAKALNARMAQQLGGTVGELDLYKGNIPYNIGDLNEAIDFLEGK